MYTNSPDNRRVRFSPSHLSGSARKEKPGAPPTESLYHDLSNQKATYSSTEFDSNKSARFSLSTAMGQVLSPNKDTSLGKENLQIFSARNETSSVQSPAQIDPFYSQGMFFVFYSLIQYECV